MVTEDARPASTDSEMLDEHVHPDAGDDAVGNGPATFSREHERTNDIGIQKDIETKLQDADEPKSALSGPSSDEDEPNSSDEENREGQPHAWSKDQRDIDALDAERLLAIGRSDSPPAGTTVFGKKFYTKDQVRVWCGLSSAVFLVTISPSTNVLTQCCCMCGGHCLETPSATCSTPQCSHVIAGCQCASTHWFVTCGYNRDTAPESASRRGAKAWKSVMELIMAQRSFKFANYYKARQSAS